jgi:hypothetical protein
LTRPLALVNVAMVDAGIAIWESKFHCQVWRPITGIRESDRGTGPSGVGDGNRATVGDETFEPLGAPASNLSGPDFTPPFPAYPSGHAGFGGALFEVLRQFYGTDNIPFSFVSDEFNGTTRGPDGRVRPLVPRRFRSLSEAEEENGQSRIYPLVVRQDAGHRSRPARRALRDQERVRAALILAPVASNRRDDGMRHLKTEKAGQRPAFQSHANLEPGTVSIRLPRPPLGRGPARAVYGLRESDGSQGCP